MDMGCDGNQVKLAASVGHAPLHWVVDRPRCGHQVVK
jgi:hypothetical protein